MSTDTTVVLVHGARLVRCTLPILVGLLTLAAPVVGQARHGHFYHVNYYQVRPGQEKAYDSALVNVVTPVFDELVKRKAVVFIFVAHQDCRLRGEHACRHRGGGNAVRRGHLPKGT